MSDIVTTFFYGVAAFALFLVVMTVLCILGAVMDDKTKQTNERKN